MLGKLWEDGWRLNCRNGNWAGQIFREHSGRADRWAERGVKGGTIQWGADKRYNDGNLERSAVLGL